jgi:hypothetical protein
MQRQIISARERPLESHGKIQSILIFRIVSVLAAFIVQESITAQALTDRQGFIAYIALLLLYVAVELGALHASRTQPFWICPVVLASLVTFVLGYGITNAIIFFPGISPDVTSWMNQLMFLAFLGCVSMWVGYDSTSAGKIGQRIRQMPMLQRSLKTSYRVNAVALWSFLAISLATRLWEMRLGVYGYASDLSQLYALANVRMFLGMADSLGVMALIGVSMQCFAQKDPPAKDRLLLGLVFIYELFFGFLSGFKSSVVMPFVIVGLVYYALKNRIPRMAIVGVLVSVVVAYAVIQPARTARVASGATGGTDVGSIIALGKAGMESGSVPQQMIFMDVLDRFNVTFVGSQGIEYAALHHPLPPGSPAFLEDILTAPVAAIVPRFLWTGKSIDDKGLWYTVVVRGQNVISASAMGMVTFLNFADGPPAVIIGFLLIGIMQRALFDGFRNRGGGGFIVLFGLLGTIADIKDSFSSLLINSIRMIPILIMVQYIFLRRSQPKDKPGLPAVM